jgi:multidrug resistance efflux pump
MNQNSNPDSRLKPIPIPLGRRWREFRRSVVPGVAFVAAAFAVALMWNRYVQPPTLQGLVEAVQSNVASPRAGVITQINVSRFQKVSQGDVMAVVVPNDPRLPLALLQSEIDVLRARMEPRLAGQRNATGFQQLRLEWLLQKVRLASARVNLARAENELRRSQQLVAARVISEDLHDEAVKNEERIAVEVGLIENVVEELSVSLEGLKASEGSDVQGSVMDETVVALEAHEKKLRIAQESLGPILLKAPMDGVVQTVFKRSGETVQDGDLILALSGLESQRIIGYLRQPISRDPEVGMDVEVRTRAAPPVVLKGEILHVGNQYEEVDRSLAFPRPGGALDVGLPIAVTLPPGLPVRPGEVVDLVIHPGTR